VIVLNVSLEKLRWLHTNCFVKVRTLYKMETSQVVGLPANSLLIGKFRSLRILNTIGQYAYQQFKLTILFYMLIHL
jgi:hypothetical protein